MCQFICDYSIGREPRVLDVGGSTGGLAVARGKNGRDVTALEPDPVMAAEARRRIADARPAVPAAAQGRGGVSLRRIAASVLITSGAMAGQRRLGHAGNLLTMMNELVPWLRRRIGMAIQCASSMDHAAGGLRSQFSPAHLLSVHQSHRLLLNSLLERKDNPVAQRDIQILAMSYQLCSGYDERWVPDAESS